MVTSLWMNRVAAAASEDEIVSAIRGLVAGWTSADIAQLPAECRPREIANREDLVKFAAEVTACYRSRRHAPGAAYLLKEMVEILNFAVDRARQVTPHNAPLKRS